MKRLIVLCLCGIGVIPLSAQTPAVPTDKLAWDMKQDPVGLTFAVLVDGTRLSLPSASCGALVSGAALCQAALPAMTPGTHRLEVIASGTIGGVAVDSTPSQPLSVSFIAIVTPENVRLIKG